MKMGLTNEEEEEEEWKMGKGLLNPSWSENVKGITGVIFRRRIDFPKKQRFLRSKSLSFFLGSKTCETEKEAQLKNTRLDF